MSNRETKVPGTPGARAGGASTPGTPGTPGTPNADGSVSNDELLDHLHSRAQVFNQLWQAVEKVQGDSISISTWKAKLKELDDAKAVSRKLKNELQASSAKNSELVTSNAELNRVQEELRAGVKTRDSRLKAAHGQISDLGKQVEDVRLGWQKSESKVKRELSALKERHGEKIEEITSAQEQIKQLVKEMQQLKMELLRTKEVSRIETEAMNNELAASRANITALEADKDKISAHLWNVTDEIKKLATQLGESELLRENAEKQSKEYSESLNKLTVSSKNEIESLNKALASLRSKYDVNLAALSSLRTKHDEEVSAMGVGTKELRDNLQQVRKELADALESNKGLKTENKDTAEALQELQTSTGATISDLRDELSNERAAHRALLNKLEKDLIDARKELQINDHDKSRIELQLEDRNRMIEELRKGLAGKEEELTKWQKDLMDKETAKNTVTKRLENQLMANRSRVKELTAALDNMQVKADAELGMERDRTSEAENKLERQQKLHGEEMKKVKSELDVLTEETFRLRSAVSRAEKATEKAQEQAANYKAEIDAGEEDISSIQTELRQALEQHVKDSNRAKEIAEKQAKRLKLLEEEKMDILKEAGSLNTELSLALKERTNVEEEVARVTQEKENVLERLEISKRSQDELKEQLNESHQRIEELTHGSYKSEEQRQKEIKELRRELKLTQKEAASRVARFSEQGRELATEIQKLTLEKRVLQEDIEKNNKDIDTKDGKIRELTATLNDVHKLRDAVGKEAAAMKTTMREQNAKIMQQHEELESLKKMNDEEKIKSQQVDKERKIADRKRKEAERHVVKAEKEKMASALLAEKKEQEKQAIRVESKMRKEKCNELESRVTSLLADRDRELGSTAKQIDALKVDITELKTQLQKSRDAEDLERARREEVEKKVVNVRTEAHTTVESLMRECQALKTSKKNEVEKLTKQLEQQIDFATTMKRERDRQAENSKSAINAMQGDADTQRRLANLLEKEKTELKKMLQEKWTECQKMSLRVDEITETNSEAMRELDDWKSTKASLDNQIKRLEKEKAEMGWRAKETEDKLRSELKETTGRASHLAAEITSMKHQALWSERESGVKTAQLEREISTLKAALDHKTKEHKGAEGEIESQQMQMRDMQNTSEYTIGLLRKELEETNNRSRMTAMEMKRSVDDLRFKTNEAEDAVEAMRKELRAKKLQTDSLSRELKHMTAEVHEKSRQLDSTESSRNSLLAELERTRGDKTSMVHQVMEARDGAADEASQLSRQITGLNLRVSSLSEELDKAHNTRAKLETNLRKQIMEELRSNGMLKDAKDGKTSGIVISPSKDGQDVFTAELGSDALLRASANTDPVKAMRELRESLVTQLEADRDLDRMHEKTSAASFGQSLQDYSPEIQLKHDDENTRDFNNAEMSGTHRKAPEIVSSDDQAPFVSTGNAAKDSVLRTERFLEKRRRRERYLEQQIQQTESSQRDRENGYEQMVERKTNSRESVKSRDSQGRKSRGSSRGGIRPGSKKKKNVGLPGIEKSKAKSGKRRK